MTKLLAVLAAALALATPSLARGRYEPTITSLTNPSRGVVDIAWSPALGGTARVKRDCQLTCGVGMIYYVPDTGSAELTGQPPGMHYFRVCQQFCSAPVGIDIQ